jgi:glycyl-tRNA synthetase beta chain
MSQQNQSMQKAPLLIELCTEELPPKSLKRLGESFTQHLQDKLIAHGLMNETAKVTTYTTPRRLAVHFSEVRTVAADQAIREKLLPVSIALDGAGKPTDPLIKKLVSLGHANYSIDKLERAGEGKAESFYLNTTQAGIHLQQGLQESLDFTLTKLPIAKVMSYQINLGTASVVDVQFVRPAHGLVVLHGDSVVNVEVLGLKAGRSTFGHRFLSENTATRNAVPQFGAQIEIKHADDYEGQLIQIGKVIPSFEKRLHLIKESLLKTAGEHQVLMPQSLLEEVNSLVEWPTIYSCEFEQDFLEVPQECLILTMQTNQKYFALTDAQGKLVNRFLIVSNIETKTPQAIISGNERVVRPRLADARFFFTQDRKKKLIDRVPDLGKVVYHNKLGNQFERVQRVQEIAKNIAQLLVKANLAKENSIELAGRAALLAKADLLTDMVGEFPELQGIMGTYYANHDQENSEVAAACTEHYQPRFAGDTLPTTTTGLVLAIADKIETLVGIWGIGLHPTGEKDPFALRRHALGICRLLIEKGLPLSLTQLIEIARAQFQSKEVQDNATIEKIQGFILDRLRAYLKDTSNGAQGNQAATTYSTEEIEAVLGQTPDQVHDLPKRLKAVKVFQALPESQPLAAANKRIGNILKKVEGELPTTINASLMKLPAETALNKGMQTLAPQINAAYEGQDFTQALKLLAGISDAVSTFFDDVMVMDPDIAQRNNRLALLNQLHQQMNRVADLSKLAR